MMYSLKKYPAAVSSRNELANCPKRTNAGFTLVEILAATIVLTLVTMVVVMGISWGGRMMTQSQFDSKSDVLADTINTAVGDAVHFRGISRYGTDYPTAIEYRGYMIDSPTLQVNGDGQLVIAGSDLNNGNASIETPLLNASAYDNLKVDYCTTVGNTDAQNEAMLTNALQSGNLAYTITDGTMTKRVPANDNPNDTAAGAYQVIFSSIS